MIPSIFPNWISNSLNVYIIFLSTSSKTVRRKVEVPILLLKSCCQKCYLADSQSWMLFVIIIFRIHTAWKFLYRQQVRVLDTGLRMRARGQFQNFSNSLSSYTPDLKFANSHVAWTASETSWYRKPFRSRQNQTSALECKSKLH